MASKRSFTKTKSKARAAEFLQKPRGVISPRVQKVGPEHFGIVAVERTFQSRTVDDVVLWAKNAAAPVLAAALPLQIALAYEDDRQRKNLEIRAWRSLGSPTPDAAAWGSSSDVPVWRDGEQPRERMSRDPVRRPPTGSQKTLFQDGRVRRP